MEKNYWVKVALMPVMGMALVVFLPVIGFVMVGQAMWKKLSR